MGCVGTVYDDESDPAVLATGPGRLIDLANAYVADVRRRGLSQDTARAYRRTLAAVVRYLAQRRIHRIAQVRSSHVEAWALGVKRGRCETRPGPLSPGTVRTYVRIVRRFFAWLIERDVILADPAQALDVRDVCVDPVSRLTVPSEVQMRTLLDQAPRTDLVELRDAAVLELVYSTGLRIGEVRNLDLGDIDTRQRLVRVRRGKGRKDRVVPMGEPASDALLAWLNEGRPQLARDRALQAVFVTVYGTRLGRNTMSARLARLQRLLGLPRFRVHDLRHASALHMLRHGADLVHVQALLGHASMRATQIYTRLEPADLKAVHRRAHPRARSQERS